MKRFVEIGGGPLPMALRVFWEVVGGIDLMFDYESANAPDSSWLGLEMPELDPLCVDAPQRASWQLESWKDERAGTHHPDLVHPFEISLAPDYLHKAGISGGHAYSVPLAFPGVDPPFRYEAHELSFVDYLRFAFRWGGFTRLDRHEARPGVRELVAELAKDLPPF